jgi:hypothetical protein
LATDPLGLPISFSWEYIVLGVIGIIAYNIAWKVSPGGLFGGEIHWIVRFLAFLVLWAVTYGLIVCVQWVIANWLLTLAIVIGTLGIVLATVLTVKAVQRSRKANKIQKQK